LIKNHNYAIVMDTNIYLKSAPNSSGKDLYLVHEGLKLQVIDAVDTWTQIRMDDGNEAWVESKYLEQI
jgi:SH3-like domain-containing protein